MEDRKQEKVTAFQIRFVHRSFIKRTRDAKEVMEPKDIGKGTIFYQFEKASAEARRLNEAYYPGWKYFVSEIQV